MTLKDFLVADGCVLGSIQKLQFTGQTVKIVNCEWEDCKKIPRGDYWIESISRMGHDSNPYYKLELKLAVEGGHHVAGAIELQDVYLNADDFSKVPVKSYINQQNGSESNEL